MNNLAGSLKLRLSTGLAAQSYSRLVTIGGQLISVPILISSWGVDQYGVWLLISAIPAYLALADLGFAQVGGNDMTMRLARGDRDGARVSYQTTFAVNCLLGLICFIAIAGITLSPLSDKLIGNEHTGPDVRSAIILLTAHALISLLRGVIGAGLRSVGKYSLFIALSATMRLIDTVVVLVLAMLGWGLLEAAAGMLVCAAAAIAAIGLWFQREHPSLKLGLQHASRAAFTDMLPSSVHFLGFTLGNLITIQGATIVIGAMLGPAAVALTGTVRTLVRTGITAANMISNTLQIEYAALFGRAEWTLFNRLFRWHMLAIGGLVAVYLVLMLSVGPMVFDLWTHGELGKPRLLLAILALSVAFDMAWTALQTPSISVNHMRLTGRTFFVVGCIGLLALGLMLRPFGVMVFGWVSLAMSVVMLIAAELEFRQVFRKKR